MPRTPDLKKRFRAFISYKHGSNAQFAAALERALKTYAKPLLARPIEIFRDEKYLVPDNDLPDLIKAALSESDFLVLLASSAAAQSAWVQDELKQWAALGRMDRLIIVLTDPDGIVVDPVDRTIDWAKSTALPPLLRAHLNAVPLYVDLSWVAAGHDLTTANPRFKQAINAISARLRGLNPNEMLGEEVLQYRRNRRLLAGGVVALGLFAVTAAIALVVALREGRRLRAEIGRRIESERTAHASAAIALAGDIGSEATSLTEAIRAASLGAGQPGDTAAIRPRSETVRALSTALYEAAPRLAIVSKSRGTNAIAFSRDGAVVATTHDDGLRAWDARTGRLRFAHATSSLRDIDFSNEGSRILALTDCDSDITPEAWLFSSEGSSRRSFSLPGCGGRIRFVKNDSSAAVFMGGGGALTIDLLTGRTETLASGVGTLEAAVGTLSRDRAVLAAIAGKGRVAVWNLKDGDTRTQERSVEDVSLSPDGRFLAVRNLGAWRIVPSGVSGAADVPAPPGVDSPILDWSSDGQAILTGGTDNTARVWNAAGEPVAEVKHQDWVLSGAFAANGSIVVSLSRSSEAKVSDSRWGQTLFETTLSRYVVSKLAVSPEPGGALAFGGSDPIVWLWRPWLACRSRALGGKVFPLVAGDFSRDGRLVATASYGPARIWSSDKGGLRASLGSHVDKLTLSSDGTRIATANRHGKETQAQLWILARPESPIPLVGHSAVVTSVRFAGDGTRLITAADDGTALLWNGVTGERLPAVLNHGTPIIAAALSRSGEIAVTAGEDGTFKIWRDGRESCQSRVVDTEPSSVAISPDGHLIASGGRGGSLLIVDDPCGASRVARVPGDGEFIMSVQVFDNDVVGAAGRSRAGLWNARGDLMIAVPGLPPWATVAVHLDPAQQELTVLNDQGVLRTFPASAPSLLSLACEEMHRRGFADQVAQECRNR